MQSKGRVVAPQAGRSVPEFSATYADVTEQRLGNILAPGSHATVNINDSIMWHSNDLVALHSNPASQAEYGARKRYLQQALDVVFPLAEYPWSSWASSPTPIKTNNSNIRAHLDKNSTMPWPLSTMTHLGLKGTLAP